MGGVFFIPPNPERVKKWSNLKENVIIGFPGPKTTKIEWSILFRSYEKMKIFRKKCHIFMHFMRKPLNIFF